MLLSLLVLLLLAGGCGQQAPPATADGMTPKPAVEQTAPAKTAASASTKTSDRRDEGSQERFQFFNQHGETVNLGGFVILARDAETGDLGFAAISNLPGAGGLIGIARAGVGIVVGISKPNSTWPQQGIALLEQGKTPEQVIKTLTELERPTTRRKRMLLVMDRAGHVADFVGWKVLGSPRTTYTVKGKDCMTAGCLLQAVPSADLMLVKFGKTGGLPLPERLLLALGAGWDVREGGPLINVVPACSGVLQVVRPGGGYDGRTDRLVDLRVDFDRDPLRRLVQSYRAWSMAVLGPRLRQMQKAIRDTRSTRYARNREWLYRLSLQVDIGEKK